MRFIDREEVARRLTYEMCIPIVRDAMIAFSRGETKQTLRTIIPLSEGRLFGIMPGAMGAHAVFGAKLLSAFDGNAAHGRQSHQGVVVLFEPDTGEAVCAAHAGEITAIRTAAASAVANADIICTVSGASEPILKGELVRPGTHVNVVGSSHAGPAEVDNELVARSRFIADSREGVLRQGAEFLRAKAAGVVGDEHVV